MNCKRTCGFSLTEVMVAMSILTLVMGGSYQLNVSAMRLNRTARNHYVAVVLANSRLERAKMYNYPDLYLLAENAMTLDANGNSCSSGDYQRATLVNTNYGTNLTEISVRIQIRDLKTGAFGQEAESNSCLFTEYLLP